MKIMKEVSNIILLEQLNYLIIIIWNKGGELCRDSGLVHYHKAIVISYISEGNFVFSQHTQIYRPSDFKNLIITDIERTCLSSHIIIHIKIIDTIMNQPTIFAQSD